MRLPQFLLPLVIFVVVAMASLLAAFGLARLIESQSEIAVRGALDGAELTWAEVQADGLRVTLTGVASSEAERLRAVSTSSEVVDSARIIDAMEVVREANVAPPTFTLEILRNSDSIQLIGLVPSATPPDEVRDMIARRVSSEQVESFLEVADHPAPEGWEGALGFAIDAMERLPRSQISASSERVRVTAIADSPAARSLIEGDLLRLVPDEIDIALNISAPRPVVTPFVLRFVLDAQGPRFDSCTADTEEGRARIIRASRALGVEGQVQCTLALGVPSRSWTDAVELSLAALKDLGGGTVTFSDADIALVALEGVDAALFETRMGALEAALPDLFALQAVRPKSPDEQESAPSVTAIRTAEGAVQISGRMPDELSRDTALSVTQALFGTDKVSSTLRVGEALPSGWSLRVLTGLEALGALHHGQLDVTEGGLTLSGVTGDQEANTKITGLLSRGLGEGARYELDVSYDEQFDPIARLKGPDECIAAIHAITADRKIGFEPGAATIDSGTAAILDDIAVTLRNCHNVRLEIAGHTDSQGREEMNAALSQARAESVLEELSARRVLTSAFVARGYGEAQPIADNDTEEGREANRRIEFTLIRTNGGEGDAPSDAQEESEE